ncbi:hypothetical protein [Saccharomonospora sp. NB11]|uniref:hypothetical protein n=1 Tax=Saccharomonospora sp. NB11 TaxID=1642298 RepID=UPI0018D14FF5|nr:hypothetical protein [Saccharomonospora sp. NB11]
MYADESGVDQPGRTPGSPGYGYGVNTGPTDVRCVMRDEGAEVADLVNRARSRSDGFQYGSDRAIGARPNWAARGSEQLYTYATVNNEPATAEELGQTWGNHGGELARIADDLYNAIKELGSAWVGQGAGAAQGALVGIANSSAQASEAAHTMRDRLAQQASAAAKLKTMPQPKEFDPAAQMGSLLAGGPAAMVIDMKRQHAEAQAVKAQQIMFLEAYTEELSQIDSTTPSFGPESLGLKPLGNGVAVEARSLGASGTYSVSGVDSGAPYGSAGVPKAAVNTAVDAYTNLSSAVSTETHGVATGSASTTGSGQVPASAPTGGVNAGSALGAAAAGGAVGYAGLKAAKGLSGKRTGAKGEVATSDTVASTADRSGSVAPNAVGSGSAPAQGVATAAPAPGGPVGAAPSPAAAAGAPMGMGAGAGRKDEDKEHTHASFLIEPDPDETFGATEAAAPPVLGAWGPDEG